MMTRASYELTRSPVPWKDVTIRSPRLLPHTRNPSSVHPPVPHRVRAPGSPVRPPLERLPRTEPDVAEIIPDRLQPLGVPVGDDHAEPLLGLDEPLHVVQR